MKKFINIFNEEKNKIKTFKEIKRDVFQICLKKNEFHIDKTCKELNVGRSTAYRNYRDLLITNQTKTDTKKKIKVGDKVTHKPDNEKGIVKSLNKRKRCAWVVYSCGGDWKNYTDYTGEGTFLCDLKLGWKNEQ